MALKQPQGSNTVTPYLTLKNADQAIEFYKYVFGAEEEFRMNHPDGKVMHASMRIGDSQIMMTEERLDCAMPMLTTRSSTYVYVDDPDAAYMRAKEKGAKPLMDPADQFYGDRTAHFTDPFGQAWTVAIHVEDVSHDELDKRAKNS